MIKWVRDNRDAIIRNSFLLPILLVVIMSISHVVSWYDLGNPISWAIYLSVAIEIFALASVSASSIKMKRGSIWFLFGLVTLIQITGNIFYEFRDINPTGADFISWMELIQPIFEDWEVLEHRRFLAAIQGGTLPLMSLTALHFYIKFSDLKDGKIDEGDETDKYFDARNAKISEMTAANQDSNSTVMTPPNGGSWIHEETADNFEEDTTLDKAAEIEAKIDEELKKAASEPDSIKPEDPHAQKNIDRKKDSRETTPIFSKQIDPKTGKFTHKKIKPHGDT